MSLIRGAIGGVVGYAVGALILVSIRVAAGNAAWEVESVTAGAWLFALSGWLLGVGVWRYWAAPWFGRPERVYDITGWKRYFAFDTDHKVIGIQYLVTFLTLFFMAGLFAMLMRWELFSPGRDIMAAGTYNSIMSLHGTMMVFVAVAGTVGSFGNYVVPIMIGADDMAFPKLNALSYWLVPPVLFALTVSFLTGGYDTGWTGYAPLSVRSDVGGRGKAVDLHPHLRVKPPTAPPPGLAGVRGAAHALRQPGGGLLQLRCAGHQWPCPDRQAFSAACVLTARLTTSAVPARRIPIGVSSLRTGIQLLGPRSAGPGPGLISSRSAGPGPGLIRSRSAGPGPGLIRSRRAVPRCVPDRRRLPLPHGRGTLLHPLCLQRLCEGRGHR